MVAQFPFDLLRRLADAPLDPLVDALRALHAKGSADVNELSALLVPRGDGGPPESSGNRGVPPAVSGAGAPTEYEAARRHFIRHSEKLREQAQLADRLLDGFARSNHTIHPRIRQHELRLRCAVGGTSGARFVVANSLGRAATVRFRAGRVHAASPEQAAAVHLTFDPGSPRLEPGEEREVQLSVELAAVTELPAVLEAGVDVLADEQLLLKMWVRIDVCGENA
jgi:hypothetical protein